MQLETTRILGFMSMNLSLYEFPLVHPKIPASVLAT